MALLELKDVSLYYLQAGIGPDIVWIPGGDAVAESWQDQIEAFRGDFRNTAFDPRGAGRTVSRRAPPWSIADYAADVAALIRAKCEPPVFVCGLSMGALITQQLALDYPELVRCAIPMGTVAKATGFCREWMIAEVEFRRRGGELTTPFAVTHYAAFCYPSEVLGDEALWAKIREPLYAAYGHRASAMLIAQWQACIDFDCVQRLPDCKVPIHVIAFAEDLQTPAQHGRRVAELAGDGHFHLLAGMGHASVQGHKPELANECIRNILRRYL